MKTAISVPDRTYKAAERAAGRMRVPRSQFYARAVEASLAKTGEEDVTDRLDAVYGAALRDPDPFVLAAARAALRRPVLVLQADSFNRSRIDRVVVASLTSNLELAKAPGNVVSHRPTPCGK